MKGEVCDQTLALREQSLIHCPPEGFTLISAPNNQLSFNLGLITWLPFQNFTWCWILLGILVITLGGLISSRRLSTISTLFPQYHLCPLCFELNHRPRSCFTTPRYTQCIASMAMPLTMSKLGNCNNGLGALMPQTCKRKWTFRCFPIRCFKNN